MLLKNEKMISFSVRWIHGEESPSNAGDSGDMGLISESGGSSEGENFPVFFPGKFQGQRSLAGLESKVLQRVGHDRVHTHTHIDTWPSPQNGDSTSLHEALQGSRRTVAFRDALPLLGE